MESIRLTDQLTLRFEPLEEKVRLIVAEGENELACRKEKKKNLFDYLTTDKTDLFKGRLQLKKYDNHIEVHLKGQIVGMLSAEDFKDRLNKMQ